VSQGFLPPDGGINQRIAAAMKNKPPITTLSRALTGSALNRKPPMAPGQSQQTMPANARMMARILIANMGRPAKRKLRFIWGSSGAR
jgi:hypothetical protein